MTRIDESVSRQRGRTVRATTVGDRRARFFTRALAACAVMLTASCAAFSADFYGSSSAASAAAKSQYLRARQQEAAQAQLQRQQEALLLQRQAAEAENLRRMELARRQTAAAEQATAQEGRSSSGSSKGLFSGISNLWDGSRSSSQSQNVSQPRQPLLTAPFQQSSQPEPRQEGPERNNAFGYRPLFKRSSLSFNRLQGDKAAAREWFEKALARKEGQIDTLYFLSRYDEEEGNRAAALEKMEKALEGRFSPLNFCSKEMAEQEVARLKGETV